MLIVNMLIKSEVTNLVQENKKDESVINELIENLAKTATIMDVLFEKFYQNYNLTRVQFYALYLIEAVEEKGMPLSLLGEKMSVSRANITTLMDRMEKSNLVRREMDITDRRSTKVFVTEEGKIILNKILPKKETFIKEVFSFLTEKELIRGNELLLKVQDELQKIEIK